MIRLLSVFLGAILAFTLFLSSSQLGSACAFASEPKRSLLAEAQVKVQGQNPEQIFKAAIQELRSIAELYTPVGAQMRNRKIETISAQVIDFDFDASMTLYTPHVNGLIKRLDSSTVKCSGEAALIQFEFEKGTTAVIRGHYRALEVEMCMSNSTNGGGILVYRGYTWSGVGGLNFIEKAAGGTVKDFIRKQVPAIQNAALRVYEQKRDAQE